MPLNVLIVDDSAVMRAIIAKTLRASGLAINQVYQAANGEDALKSVHTNEINLAMLDINMPGMNGVQLLERLRQDPSTRNLPIVVVSTESSDTRIAALHRLGAGFVHKPFTANQLKEIVLAKTGEAHVQSV